MVSPLERRVNRSLWLLLWSGLALGLLLAGAWLAAPASASEAGSTSSRLLMDIEGYTQNDSSGGVFISFSPDASESKPLTSEEIQFLEQNTGPSSSTPDGFSPTGRLESHGSTDNRASSAPADYPYVRYDYFQFFLDSDGGHTSAEAAVRSDDSTEKSEVIRTSDTHDYIKFLEDNWVRGTAGTASVARDVSTDSALTMMSPDG